MSGESRALLEDLLKRRFFYCPAFSIYGGISGLYDFGPPGCAIKANIENVFRKHFIIHENMLEVNCTCLTPAPVLKSSGHVDRFTDLMVRNEKKPDEVFRADKLLEEKCQDRIDDPNYKGDKNELVKWQRMADSFSADEVDEIFTKMGIKQELNLSKPFPFNLMFQTTIGPQVKKMMMMMSFLFTGQCCGIHET
jgi:glycyl-tRNA synthetase